MVAGPEDKDLQKDIASKDENVKSKEVGHVENDLQDLDKLVKDKRRVGPEVNLSLGHVTGTDGPKENFSLGHEIGFDGSSRQLNNQGGYKEKSYNRFSRGPRKHNKDKNIEMQKEDGCDEQNNSTVRKEKRAVSPSSSVGSGGDRTRKKKETFKRRGNRS